MSSLRFLLGTLGLFFSPLLVSGAGGFPVTFTHAEQTGLSVEDFDATGKSADVTLGFAPPTGTSLMLVEVTGAAPITGRLDDLAQGRKIDLEFDGIRYPFIVNYYGGTGNDLVLEWGSRQLFSWGSNERGQLGHGDTLSRDTPTPLGPSKALEGKTVVAVETGSAHTLALCADGTLLAWGVNDRGQLGDGTQTDRRVPVEVDRTGVLAGKRVIAIAAGAQFSIALCEDGTLASWGRNNDGSLGTGSLDSSLVPVAIDRSGVLSGQRVTAIDAGNAHVLALDANGSLYSWGNNSSGQLGADTSSFRTAAPVAVDGSGILAGRRVTALAVGQAHNLVLCADGTVAVWGPNNYGQLGDNTRTRRTAPSPVHTEGLLSGKTIRQISSGGQTSMFLAADETLGGWGYSDYGELGTGTTGVSEVAVEVDRSGVLFRKRVVEVRQGGGFTLARTSDGTLAAWGANGDGSLGAGPGFRSLVPTRCDLSLLTDEQRPFSLHTGPTSRHSIAIIASPPPPGVIARDAVVSSDTSALLQGRIEPNGRSVSVSFEYGLDTGYGRRVAASPSDVSGRGSLAVSAQAAELRSGSTYHYRIVAVTDEGTIFGEDRTFTTSNFAELTSLQPSSGRLSPAFAPPVSEYQLTVPFSTTSLSLIPASAHPDATIEVDGGSVLAGNPSSEIGLSVGTQAIVVRVTSGDGGIERDYTVRVTRMPETFAIASGSDSILTAGSFDLDGLEFSSRLDFPPSVGENLPLLEQTGLSAFSSRFSNVEQGQLLLLEHGGIRYPYFANYSGGDGNDLVLEWWNRRLAGWGRNNNGTLGTGEQDSSSVPVPVELGDLLGDRALIKIQSGSNHSVALLSDGSLLSWGSDYYQQLGNGDQGWRSRPGPLATDGALANRRVRSIASGSNHSLALCADGTLLAWGNNSSGQIGDGTFETRSAPTPVIRSGVLAGREIVAIAAGFDHSLALCSDGTLAAWGGGVNGQLGTGFIPSTSEPIAVDRSGVLYDRKPVAIAAAGNINLVLCDDGSVVFWGFYLSPDDTGPARLSGVPIEFPDPGALAGRRVVEIATTGLFSVARTEDGAVASWGRNYEGLLGVGDTLDRAVPTLIDRRGVLARRSILGLRAGGAHIFADSSDRSLVAWGGNQYDQLGVGDNSPHLTPVRVDSSILETAENWIPGGSSGGSNFSHAIIARPPPPVSTTLAATAVSDQRATMHARVSPNGTPTSVRFEYGPTPDYGNEIAASTPTLSGTGDVLVEGIAEGLLTGTTYHYRAVVSNANGEWFGEGRTFTTTAGATLTGLEISAGMLSPAFSQEITSYGVAVANSVSEVRVIAFTDSPEAVIRVDGAPLTSGLTSDPVTLAEGDNTITIEVEAPGGLNRQTYGIRVTRTPGVFRSTAADQPVIRIDRAPELAGPKSIELNFAPPTGAELVLIEQTGLEPLQGRFDGLGQGQRLTLRHAGIDYPFLVNYFGGSGNDLTLQWANTRIFGWGPLSSGRLGIFTGSGRIETPTLIDSSEFLDGRALIAFSKGGTSSIFVRDDGLAAGIGSNNRGILGTGSGIHSTYVPVPVATDGVLKDRQIVRIALGGNHTIALCADGTVVSWGDNDVGQLGNGTLNSSNTPVEVDLGGVLAGKRVVAIDSGNAFALALCSDGTVASWGSNSAGQLGDGTGGNSAVPVAVDVSGTLAGRKVIGIETGRNHVLARCSDGSLVSWGSNESGQLGDGSTENSSVPVEVVRDGVLAGRVVTALKASSRNSLALCADGTVAVWGNGGLLGNGSTSGNTDAEEPILVEATGVLAGKTPVALGGGIDTFLVVCADGSAVGWGRNSYGQLGNGDTSFREPLPVAVDTANLRMGQRIIRLSGGYSGFHEHALVALPPAPTAISREATAVTDNSATLRGTALANGSATTFRFDYGLTDAYGSQVVATPAGATGTGEVEATAAVGTLLPDTTYHFRFVCENAGGISYGENRTFTTPTLGTLAGLTLDAGSLEPAFDLRRTDYVAAVPAAANVVTVTPLASAPDARILVNGRDTPSGAPSHDLELSLGNNLIVIDVTSANGLNRTIYTLRVTRMPQTFDLTASGTPSLSLDGIATGGPAPPISLGFAPDPGTTLTLIDNTGLHPVAGRFDDLPEGARISLEFGGVAYPYAVTYFGGDGNDLTLEWANRRLLATGYNQFGTLGNGQTGHSAVPVRVDDTGVLDGRAVRDISCGNSHVLALCWDGSVVSWGNNFTGRLGNGSTSMSRVPVAVRDSDALAGRTVIAVAAGGNHSLALCDDGTLVTWGDGDVLGTTIEGSFSSFPVEVDMSGALVGKRPIRIAAGNSFCLVVCSDGTVVGWGSNHRRQLGVTGETEYPLPVEIDRSGILAGKRVIDIAAGQQHALALCADGTLVAWGDNSQGQLGIGNISSSELPVAVPPGSVLAGHRITALAAGNERSFVLREDGVLVGWGNNQSGSLGDGTTATSHTPRVVADADGLGRRSITSLMAMERHSLVFTDNGALFAWGNNSNGAFGNGTTDSSATPVGVDLSSVLLPGESLSDKLPDGLANGYSILLTNAPPPPSVTTLAADDLNDSSLTLRAEVMPNGYPAELRFEYGTTPAYGSWIDLPAVNGTGSRFVEHPLVGLAPGTTIHYRITASGPGGAMTGEKVEATTTSNATLASLAADEGEFWPAFDPTVVRYSLTVPSGTTSVSLTARPTKAGGTMTLDGAPLPADTPSAPIALPAGMSEIPLLVTAASGSKLTYTLEIVRIPETITFNDADVPAIRASQFQASGSPRLELGFAPEVGTELTVVDVTDSPLIDGRFENLHQGGTISLDHGGIPHEFLIDYRGGNGNDLVLRWANSRLFSWGRNFEGQLGNGDTYTTEPMPVTANRGPLAGQRVMAVSAGELHSVAILADGRVLAWGENRHGQLGNGQSFNEIAVPVDVSADSALADRRIVAVAAGGSHSLALDEDGVLYGWGANFNRELGATGAHRHLDPVVIDPKGALLGRRIVAISAGSGFSLAVCDDGKLVAWGSNTDGRLGVGHDHTEPLPVLVGENGLLKERRVITARAGSYHGLALCTDGTLLSWGRNDYGSVGDGTTEHRFEPVFVDTSGLLAGRTVRAIDAGTGHNLALCTDGILVAWGRGASGQLGNRTMTDQPSPVAVDQSGPLSGRQVVAIECISTSSFALCDDGTLVGWGKGNYRELGTGESNSSDHPVEVSRAGLAPAERFSRITGGSLSSHMLATVANAAPPLVETLAATDVNDTSATLRGRFQAAATEATLYFEYGLDAGYGQQVEADPGSVAPATATGADAALSDLAAGTTWHYRAVAESATGTSYGENRTFITENTAGLAALDLGTVPLTPAFQTPVTDYTAAASPLVDHLLVSATAIDPAATIRVNGTLYSEGMKIDLGSGSTELAVEVRNAASGASRTYSVTVFRFPETVVFAEAATPVLEVERFRPSGPPPGFALVFAPSPGTSLPMVAQTGLESIDGRFDGLPQGQPVAIEFGGITYRYVVNYHGGSGNDLVLEWANRRVFGWGNNNSSQLGDGTRLSRSNPGPVDPGPWFGRTILHATTGSNAHHSLAVCADGSLFAWGSNSFGQLGIGDTESYQNPVDVSTRGALANRKVVQAATGWSHSLALCDDGTLVAWGANRWGQLGDGTFTDRLIPVEIEMTGVLAGKTVIAISAGDQRSYAACSDGTVAAWGVGGPAIGNGTTGISSHTPAAVARDGVLRNRIVVALDAGDDHCLALCHDGTLVAWGENNYGALGDGTRVDRLTPVPVDRSGVLADKQVVGIAAGRSNSMVMCSDGTLATWGRGDNGLLGTGGNESSDVPVGVLLDGPLAGRTFQRIDSSIFNHLALTTDGTLAVWGYNAWGQLGNDEDYSSSIPLAIEAEALKPGEKFISASTGTGYVLALAASPPAPLAETLAASGVTDTRATLGGRIAPNGSDAEVRFEYGLTENYGDTADVDTISAAGFSEVDVDLDGLAPGTTYHYRLAARNGGGTTYGESRTFTTSSISLLAALSADAGELSPGVSNAETSFFLTVPFDTAEVVLSPVASNPQASILIAGNPVASGSDSPALPLDPGSTIISITLKGPGNTNSRDYTVTVTRLPETLVLGPGADDAPAAGAFSLSGITAGFSLNAPARIGESLVVLDNRGTLPISGRFENLDQGQRIELASQGVHYPYVANYFGGDGNDLVLEWANQRLVGWGRNRNQILEAGGEDSVARPTILDSRQPAAPGPLIRIATGHQHGLALTADGTVSSWGSNGFGELGRGVGADGSVPGPVDTSGVLSGRRVAAIAAGNNFSVAVLDDGRVATWGRNQVGQLGNGTKDDSPAPVLVKDDGVLAGRKVMQVAAGANQVYALCDDGTLVGWGWGDWGLLGAGSGSTPLEPVIVLPDKRAVAAAAGVNHGLALCDDGTLWSWGSNEYGQLGTDAVEGNSNPPVEVPRDGALAGKTVVEITAGRYFSAVRCDDGSVIAWGRNNAGNLGNGETSNSSLPVAVDTSGVPGGASVTSLAAGSYHAHALTDDDRLLSWGNNAYGQLGANLTANSSSLPVVADLSDLPAAGRIIDLASFCYADQTFARFAMPPAPAARTLAAREIGPSTATLHGSVKANGSEVAAFFEYGPTTAYGSRIEAVPSPVSDIGEIPVSARIDGLLSGQTIHYRLVAESPNDNAFGEDIDFETKDSTALADLIIAPGTFDRPFSPAVLNHHATVPANVSEATITATPADPTSTITINGGAGGTALPLASGTTTFEVLVRSQDATASQSYQIEVTRLPDPFHWDSPSEAPVAAASLSGLGIDATFALGFAPVPGTALTVVENSGPLPIASPFDNLPQGKLVRLEYDGRSYPFVADYRGGDGNDLVLQWAANRLLASGNDVGGAPIPTPVHPDTVLTGRTILEFSVGNNHAVALYADGTVATWGNNTYGQLGNGTLLPSSTPTIISDLGALEGRQVVLLASGNAFSLALCTDGTLVGWGRPHTGTISSTPVEIDTSILGPARRIVGIAACEHTRFAWCDDGRVLAWGENNHGQVGDGTRAYRPAPVWVDDSGILKDRKVVAVEPGHQFAIALCEDGTLASWGENRYGKLGDGTSDDRSSPGPMATDGVLSGRTIIAVAAGHDHAIALLDNGRIAAWGRAGYGQLGPGLTPTDSRVPVLVNESEALAGRRVTGIDAGYQHSVAVCADGTMAAWGQNSYGQLGDGGTEGRAEPVAVDRSNLLPGERYRRLATSPRTNSTHVLTAMDGWAGVETLAAGDILNRSALLRGSVIPDGIDGRVEFDYGPSPDLPWSIEPESAQVSGSGPASFSAEISRLKPGTTYYFRARYLTPAGIFVGAIRTFTTASDLTLASLSADGADLSPDFNPRWSRYSITVPATTGSITLTATASDPAAMVRIAGSTGGPNGVSIPLEVGSRTSDIAVTSSSGESLTYPVVLNRLPEVFNFESPGDIGFSTPRMAANGNVPPVTLDFLPIAGTSLTLVEITGNGPVTGEFDNLRHGTLVDLEYGGNAYRFVVDYHGGDGNDLVLQWANTRLFGWGSNWDDQLDSSLPLTISSPFRLPGEGSLKDKILLSTVTSDRHSYAIDATGAVHGWSSGYSGGLGNGTGESVTEPILIGGALEGRRTVSLVARKSTVIALCDDGTLVGWGRNEYGQLGLDHRDTQAVPIILPSGNSSEDPRVTSLAISRTRAAALRADGSILQWGSGINTPSPVDLTAAPEHAEVVAIHGGDLHFLALCDDGTLLAWGSNGKGQLGDGTREPSPVPIRIDGFGTLDGRRVIDIAAGETHSVALCDDGTVAVWGEHAREPDADGETVSTVPEAAALPPEVAGLPVRNLVAGYTHRAVLYADGTLLSWGANDSGALGTYSAADSYVPIRTNDDALAFDQRFMRLSDPIGERTTLVLVGTAPPNATTLGSSAIAGTSATVHGTVGANRNPVEIFFEYGTDTGYGDILPAHPATTDRATPISLKATLGDLLPGTVYHYRIVVTSDAGVVRGEDRTFLTLSDNARLADLRLDGHRIGPDFDPEVLRYFGSVPTSTPQVSVTPFKDHFGATIEVLGQPVASGSSSQNIPLAANPNIVSIRVTAEDRVTLRIYQLDVTRLPGVFELGDGQAPLAAEGFSARGVSAGFALLEEPLPGTILPVVENRALPFIHGRFDNLAHGQRVALGFGGRDYDFVADYHGGDGNDLVLRWAASKLYGWGANSHGQLGNGGIANHSEPVDVDPGQTFADKVPTRMSGGYLHSLVLFSDGTLAATGENAYGQLGTGITVPSRRPVAVDLGGHLADRTVVAISSGPFHNLALCADGTVAAWGFNNHGQLGTGDKKTRHSPTIVSPVGALAGQNVVAVAAGAYHSLALCDDGTVVGWGYNDEGELGDGSRTTTTEPVAVDTSGILAGRRVARFAAGQYHTLALCTDGTLVAWGYNARGQLGDGTHDDSTTPVKVDVAANIRDLTAGDSHSFVLLDDGTLLGWGRNQALQIGAPGFEESPDPVVIPIAPLDGGAPFAITSGRHHHITLLTDRSLGARGANNRGQLGNAATAPASEWQAVSNHPLEPGGRFMTIAAGPGAYHSLGILGVPASRPGAAGRWQELVAGEGRIHPGGPDEDPDGDGLSNLMEYAFGLDPFRPDRGALPLPVHGTDSIRYAFAEPDGVESIRYTAEWSPNLEPDSWNPLPDLGSGTRHEFHLEIVPGERRFMRLRVELVAP